LGNAWLEKVQIPQENVHGVNMEEEDAATAYARELGIVFGSEEPQFDLVLLAMGKDGHVAGLYAGLPSIADCQSLAIAHLVPQRNEKRVSLGVKVLNLAKQVIFVLETPEKRQAYELVQTAPYAPVLLPAQIVQPASGNIVWNVLR
jgi:6-phosphogluconolactonase/glucosamine-6-phosphate isomerase/deaminase